MSAAVSISALSHEWPGSRSVPPTPAVTEVDLDIEAGSFVAIVGPSGCGKSTLLRVLAGLVIPTSGSAQVDGRDVVGLPGATAWMPQNHNLLPWRRVLANATLGAEVGGSSRAAAEARARPLLKRFGLGGYERAWPLQLSGGMRQRLAVLRSFLIDAPVMLLDEPFGALDALTRRSMQTWLQGVWLDADAQAVDRRTVLLVTHDVDEALLLADRVIVMSPRPGTIVADIAVPFVRPRGPDTADSGEFVALRRTLLDALGA